MVPFTGVSGSIFKVTANFVPSFMNDPFPRPSTALLGRTGCGRLLPGHAPPNACGFLSKCSAPYVPAGEGCGGGGHQQVWASLLESAMPAAGSHSRGPLFLSARIQAIAPWAPQGPGPLPQPQLTAPSPGREMGIFPLSCWSYALEIPSSCLLSPFPCPGCPGPGSLLVPLPATHTLSLLPCSSPPTEGTGEGLLWALRAGVLSICSLPSSWGL